MPIPLGRREPLEAETLLPVDNRLVLIPSDPALPEGTVFFFGAVPTLGFRVELRIVLLFRLSNPRELLTGGRMENPHNTSAGSGTFESLVSDNNFERFSGLM